MQLSSIITAYYGNYRQNNANAETGEPMGDLAVALVVATVPVIVLVLIFQRTIVEDLIRGAVKE